MSVACRTRAYAGEKLYLGATHRAHGWHMALKRRLRKAGNSLVVTVPSQIAEMCGWEDGTVVELEAIGHDAIRLTKAAPEKR